MSHFGSRSRPVSMNTIEAIIIGGGYGGVMAANRLAAKGRRVHLVNDGPTFVNRVRLHQHTATGYEVTRPLGEMLFPEIGLSTQRAVRASAGGVRLADGTELEASHVVIATGSTGNGPATLAGADALRTTLSALPAGARIRVDGAGLSGIETATEIAEAMPHLKVSLTDPAGLFPSGSEGDRRWLANQLPRLGVVWDDGPADLAVDCTGLSAPDLASRSGMPVDGRGRLVVDQTLQAAPGIWGLGDAVVSPQLPHLRMGCATALPMGAHVADNIHRVLAGEAATGFDFGFSFRCVSLGRRNGLIEFVDRCDVPTGRRLTGREGASFKEKICRLVIDAPRRSAAGYRWLGRQR